MFERTRELRDLKRQEKKQANTAVTKRAENLLRAETRELLDEYLAQRGCESVTIEIKADDVVDFIAILPSFSEYDCDQISETLYKFTVHAFEW